MEHIKELLAYLVPRMVIYVPMIAGALIGYVVGAFGGWHAILGMAAGAAAWLAYEMRRYGREGEQQFREIARQFKELQRLHAMNMIEPGAKPEQRYWEN